MFLPFISGGAHLGGLAAGFAATALLCRGAFVLRDATPLWVRTLAHALAFVCAAAVGIAGFELLVRAELGLRYTQRIALLPGVESPVLHLRAAEVLADPQASRGELLAALSAEQRAVEATHRKQPEMLAAVAELQFRLGRTELALAAIEEALALAPDDPRIQARRVRILQGELGGRALEGELPPWLPDPRISAPAAGVEI
jgi:tetratricopeptide (TPR) repeat protein